MLGEHARGQLQFELVAFVKLFTELSTLAASAATGARSAAEGLGGSAATALLSALTEEVMALVWLGKSLFAELTSAVASLSTFVSCDFKPLIPLLETWLGSALTEFSRLVRSEQ